MRQGVSHRTESAGTPGRGRALHTETGSRRWLARLVGPGMVRSHLHRHTSHRTVDPDCSTLTAKPGWVPGATGSQRTYPSEGVSVFRANRFVPLYARGLKRVSSSPTLWSARRLTSTASTSEMGVETGICRTTRRARNVHAASTTAKVMRRSDAAEATNTIRSAQEGTLAPVICMNG